MNCKSCGKEIADETKFCPYCGASTVQEEQTVQTSIADNSNRAGAADEYYSNTSINQSADSSYKGMGIAGMVLGICSICFCWFVYVAIIAGILGIIFSAISLKRSPNGYAKAGLVLSIIGLAFFVLAILLASASIFYWVGRFY